MLENFAAVQAQPRHAIKANLFKARSHPARIRGLEVRGASERATAELFVIARIFLTDTVGTQHDQFDAIAALPPLPRGDAART